MMKDKKTYDKGECKLLINRFLVHEKGVFSTLAIERDGEVIWKVGYGVEQPWRNNQPFISCISAGEYELHRFKRKNGDDALVFINEEMGVTEWKESHSKRYTCLIHIANWPHNVEGCLGPGDDFVCNSMERTEPMVTHSALTMDRLLRLYDKYEIRKAVISWPTFEESP